MPKKTKTNNEKKSFVGRQKWIEVKRENRINKSPIGILFICDVCQFSSTDSRKVAAHLKTSH